MKIIIVMHKTNKKITIISLNALEPQPMKQETIKTHKINNLK